MIPYAIRCGDIDVHCLSLFRVVQNAVVMMKEKPDTGPGLTCHDVCEILLKEHDYLRDNLLHVRGNFGFAEEHERFDEAFDSYVASRTVRHRGSEHSWLEVKHRGALRVVIDPYPVAVASGPILVSLDGLLNPWRHYYIPNRKLTADLVEELNRR